MSEEVGTTQRLDHDGGILVCHVEKGVVGKQIDTTHIDALVARAAVDHRDEVAGVEALSFSGVDIYSSHACIGGASVFVGIGDGAVAVVGKCAVAVRSLFIFLAPPAFLGVRHIYVASVFVIIEQAIEFER